jgi:malonyl-CoA/methylmalonyl-CoA synthetase
MGIELARRAGNFGNRLAIDGSGGTATYSALLARSDAVAVALLSDRDDLRDRRVAFLVPPSADHVAVRWGIWRAGGMAVPLALSHPEPELERAVADCEPAALIGSDAEAERLRGIASRAGIELLTVPALSAQAAVPALPEVAPDRPALMVYTSGTTGAPKGVVTTHSMVQAQITALVQAWGWRADDRILHVLPLHHVHGMIVAMDTALWAGACCEFSAPFEADTVWERLASGDITVFMAVPTIYGRLIRAWENASDEARARWSRPVAGLRLMTSGSAALPVSTMERWQEITGHRLLERYGMTEIGMALSNSLDGERRAGTVGQPLPGVEARIVDDAGIEVAEGTSGQIEVCGPQVFREYWRRPEETAQAFREGWFKTGDEGVQEDGYFRILGRRSVDIIKTGGYKVSALEIEEMLRLHPAIADVAVVGVVDEEWGECVCAALVVVGGDEPPPEAIRSWCKERLAPYKVPRRIRYLERLPHNSMGKVTKPALGQYFAEPV